MPGFLSLSLSRLVMLLALAIAGYALFSTAGYVFRSYDLGQRESQLRRDVAELRRQQVELAAVRDYLESDEYLEFMARRMLGLVRPGETLVVVSGSGGAGTAAQAPPAPLPGEPWWRALFGNREEAAPAEAGQTQTPLPAPGPAR